MSFRDWYALLGLVPKHGDPSSVPLKQANKAYKRLALKWHPDKNPGDAGARARFELLQTAIETLRDDLKRKAYDEKYREVKHEEARNAQQDAATRSLKLDLTRREKEAAERIMQKQAQESNMRALHQLRRSTEERFAEAASAAHSASQSGIKRVWTYEEHCAREKAILKRMLATASQS